MSPSLTSPVEVPEEVDDLTPVSLRGGTSLIDVFRRHRQRIVAATILLIFSIELAIVVWPGRMSADTLVQIGQVRTGQYNDWHAALLLVLWRPFWLIGVGPGWVTWAAMVTFTFGLYGILRLRFGRTAAVLLTLVISMTPQVVAWVVYLGRDMWFTAFFLATGAALVRVARAGPQRGAAGAALLLVASTWLAVAARQNALPACAVLVLGCFAFLRPKPLDSPRRARLARALVVVGLAGAVMFAIVGSQWFARRAFNVEATNIEQSIYIYDLAALSHEERTILFDPEFFPAQDLALLDARWNPYSFEPLVFGPGAIIPYPLEEDAVEELRSDWLAAITKYPDSYLEERLRVWFAQLGITEPAGWVIHPGIDANDWGYVATNPTLDDALQRYVRVFASNDQLSGGVLHRVWAYVLVLVAGLWFLRSSDPVRRCAGWMSLACLVYQGTLLVGLMGSSYRLNFPCVVVALAVLAIACADGIDRVRRRYSRSFVANESQPVGAEATVSESLP